MDILRLVKELRKRTRKLHGANLIDPNFQKQAIAIRDQARFKSYNCSRRSGKTIGLSKEFIESAYSKPNTPMLYLALTGQSAYDILWSEMLDECDRNLIPTKPNKVERRIYFPECNSSLKFAGADASEREMKKILGNKFSMVGIDETGSFTVDMTKLIYQMIRPTLTDVMGKLVLSGTCENIPNTFFEKVCTGKLGGWSVHRWTAYDNPYIADNWDSEIKDILASNPSAQDTAWFRTHYLNEWVTDEDKLIIPLRKEYFINELPDRKGNNFAIGIDLGFNDATSFNIVDYSFHFPDIRLRRSYKLKGLDITAVVNEIKELDSKYDFTHMVVDGANKQAVEEMRARHGLPLQSAEKVEKGIHLRMMKDAFIQGQIKVYEKDCKDFTTECDHLIWADDSGMREDPRCENHCCFPEGVMVETINGAKDIKDVKIGDYVATSKGFKRVTVNIAREYSGEMVNLKFDDDTTIRCTSDHPFYTDIGLVCADRLTYERRFTRLVKCKKENMVERKQLSLTGLSIIDIQTLIIQALGVTLGRHMKVVAIIFTMMSIGFIMAIFLKENIYITSMVIPLIIILAILLCLVLKNIFLAINRQKKEERFQERISKRQSPRLQSGTDQKKERDGITSMGQSHLEKTLPLGKRTLRKSVEYAENFLKFLFSRKERKCVQINAMQEQEEIAGSMIPQRNASGAEKIIDQTDTLSLNFAAHLVGHEIQTVKDIVVYNLTVEDDHQYFANGILVSNCDGVLYIFRAIKHYTHEPLVVLNRDSQEFMDNFENEEAMRLQEEMENGKKKSYYNEA